MMQDYSKLVEALRCCAGVHTKPTKCPDYDDSWCSEECLDKHLISAAAAIEYLQAEVERLKDSNEELREKQTYIDHYGHKWMTSAKDVPTSAYEHGYMDGTDEAKAQLPKRGKWKCSYPEIEPNPMFMYGICSICGFEQSISNKLNYCPNCGANMEVQDG